MWRFATSLYDLSEGLQGIPVEDRHLQKLAVTFKQNR